MNGLKKDLDKLIDDCTNNEVDFKDVYYELISLRDKYYSEDSAMERFKNLQAYHIDAEVDGNGEDADIVLTYSDQGDWVSRYDLEELIEEIENK